MYRRITTVAGKTILNRFTDSSRVKTQKQRKPKRNPTPAAVARVNKENQKRELTAKLNATFAPGDWWMVLSNDPQTTEEESMEKIYKLKRGLQRYCKKNDIPFKLVESMGIGKQSGKVHHHVVLNKEIPLDVVKRYWPEEKTFAQPLKGWNYRKVADYMIKNAEESKDRRGKFKKAFRCSRQVARPQSRMEIMKRAPRSVDPEDLKPRAGYAIDRDSVNVYEHPITGAICVEYIEVSLEPEPRLKGYYKGKRVPWDPLLPVAWGDQIELNDIFEGWTI